MVLYNKLVYAKDSIVKTEENMKWFMFVDLKSAYDKVDHQILYDKMTKIGISE